MLSGQDIVNQVTVEVFNEASTPDRIIREANTAVLFMASQPGLYFPDLFVESYDVGTVPGENRVLLPDDYHKHLSFAVVSNRQIIIHDGIDSLFSMSFPAGKDGPVNGIATKGRYLFYSGSPVSPDTITISYYRKPNEITDSPSSYPEGAVQFYSFFDAIKNFVMWRIYQEIEDGETGQKPNALFYKAQFYENLTDVKNSCGRDNGPSVYSSGSGRLFY